ncbi:MAG: sorbosone dehydrogenase family protein [Dinghuibacter sp.]|nr:sorbosone dehydrogenase family protein [Dinghuibacter sp.]
MRFNCSPVNKILFGMVLFSFLACNNNTPKKSVTLGGDNSALAKKYNLDKIILPPGFSIGVYAEVPNARSMCLGENGTVFVANRSGDKVYAVVDEDRNGVAEKRFVIDEGLNQPNGVAFRKGSLYVAEISRILRYDNIEQNLAAPPEPVVVYDKYPTETHHGWKFIAFGPDDKLYVPVGAPCNICKKDNPVYSSITRINPDGSGMEVFAHGVRNSVGFDWHPETKELWFTENGRDNLGDNVPADELNRAWKKDLHFGYPYCHQGDTPDPEFGKEKPCSEFEAPAQNLGPHVAALGMRFYTGNMFLPEYKNQAFIAEHGSWNRSEAIGYRVTLCRIENNKVVQYVPFARGWLQPNGDVLGRPVDVQFLPDGSMLISDDKNGAIYRVTFKQ